MNPNQTFRLTSLAAAMLLAANAQAFEIDTGPGSEWQLRWDNTVRYNAGVRVHKQNLTGLSVNSDDGDRNFKRGDLISNRMDLLSEFDARKGDFGLRLSAAAWYDAQYNRSNQHNSPVTTNNRTAPYNEFSSGTEGMAGQRAEMLDWFAFGRNELGDASLSYRLGQHALIWGTSLFFGGNGIAKGMAPIDVYKLSIPGTQAKETTIPVPQLSTTLQLNDKDSVEAYVQFKYKPTRLHPAGSYLSATDMLGAGAERMFIGEPALSGHRCGTPKLPPTNCYLDYTGMDKGANRPNFGFALNTRSEALDADLGVYAIRYRDTSTLIKTNSTAGTYQLVVPETPVYALGMSFARVFGIANVGVESSIRWNQPLAVKEGVITAADPSYATGRTAHLNISTTMLLGPTGPWDGASIAGELAFGHVLDRDDVRTQVAGRWGAAGVSKLNTDRRASSAGMRVVFTPTYYQVAPGLDLSVPINLGWSFRGQSMIDSAFPFAGSPDRAGEFILGLTGVYLAKWTANISYINYLGRVDRQLLLDRDYVTLSLQTTF